MLNNTRRAFFVAFLCSFVLLATTTQVSAQDYGLNGRWHGTWKSESTGHGGPLNARFRSRNDGSVKAIFTGRFAVVVPFRYSMKLQPAACNDGTVRLSGSKKLGPILGSYDFAALSNGRVLNAAYSAGRDRGNFYLRNVSR